jgi:8-oxoguanine deaminase
MIGGKWLIENSQHSAVMNSQLMRKHQSLAKKIQNQAFV